jgi:predicted TPR repeat methyltransferase
MPRQSYDVQTAINYYQTGEFKLALKCCLRLIKKNKENALLYRIAGKSCADLGNSHEAIDYFRRAISIDQTMGELHAELGTEFQNIGEIEEAEKELKRAILLSPELLAAHINLGSVQTKLKKLEDAEQSYKKAIGVNPTFAISYSNLSTVYMEMDRFPDAAEACQKALELTPEFAEAHHNMGNIYRHYGQIKKASESYRRSVELRPNNAQAWRNLGASLQKINDLSGAKEAYRESLNIEPQNPDAIHMISALEGEVSNAPPDGYVQALFNSYASSFETDLVNNLNYHVPETIAKIIQTLHGNQGLQLNKFSNGLDLGCGTGLVGNYLDPVTENLVGVDVAPEMLSIAREKSIYSRLEECDILEFLKNSKKNSYDIVVAADVFVYFSDLGEVFSQVNRVLCNGGIFTFSLEKSESDQIELSISGRYKHSQGYVEKLLDSLGFKVSYFENLIIRVEHDNPNEGFLFCLQSA